MRHDPKSQMRRFIAHRFGQRYRDDGQVSILVVLAVGLFLLMFVGFGVDMTNLFLHRQMAQNAADAACVAAGMDILREQTKGPDACARPGNPNYACGNLAPVSWPSTLDCSGHSNPSDTAGWGPCQYASLNGYSSPGLTTGVESNDVTLSFPPYPPNPGYIPGIVPPNPTVGGPHPFVQVSVVDRVRVYFSAWLSGTSTQDVRALAKCGLQQLQEPVPIIILDPTCQHSLEVSGSAGVTVVGGPTKSIQVNSDNTTCAAATTSGGGQCDGNGTINLSQGGPKLTGSNIGVTGFPNSSPTCGGSGPPCTFNGGTTGKWISPAAPISDPWASLVPPSAPAQVDPAPFNVPYPNDGCPDHGGCTEYKPGWYKNNTIDVKGFTAIFQPGIYYITASQTTGNCATPGTGCLGKGGGGGSCSYGFLIESNGVVRPTDPAQAPGDGSGGTIFYLTSATSGKGASYESIYIDANAGNYGGRTIDNAPSSVANCPGFVCPPNITCATLPGSFTGNVLTGPCTGTYSVSDTYGNNYHGMLFWDDRANADPKAQPKMNGGGGLLLAGNLYFHNCPNSPTCSPTTDYNAFFDLNGTSGSSTFVFGDITTDELILGGNASINMELNPNLVLNILKVELMQ